MKLSSLQIALVFVTCALVTQCVTSLTMKRRNLFKYRNNNVKTKYTDSCSSISFFTQRVDHFNFQNDDTYEQRYILSDGFWHPGRPIFFYTGNEGDIKWFCENTGFVWEKAVEFGAMVIFAEHRYYGESMPYGNKSMERDYVKYLTSEQALADYAYMIHTFKEQIPGAKNSPVIVFGGSYGGMLSAWFRMKYPNLAAGAIAASAPIWQFIIDCDGFARVNTDTFKKASPVCPALIRASWSAINSLGKTKKGLDDLTSIFKLCKPLESSNELKDWLVDVYGNAAMSDYPYPTNFLNPLPGYPVSVICSNITNNVKNMSNPYDLLNGIYNGINVYVNYTGNQKCIDISSDTPSDINMDAWVYQTCTEFVFPTCSNGLTDMFENVPWDFDAYTQDCYKAFQVVPRAEWPVIYYGGYKLEAYSNIVFSNGDLDPWSAGGVLYNITSALPALMIQGGAHHLDLRSSNSMDPQSVINVREAEVEKIKDWISEYYKNL